MLDRSLEATERLSGEQPPTKPITGIVIGRITKIGGDGVPRVHFPGNPANEAIPATSTTAVTAADVGRQVALAFQDSNSGKPIILGLIQDAEMPADGERAMWKGAGRQSLSVEADGERITLTAEKEIVLRCGEASITLTRAGKVIIRGAYLVSRASGVNRIKGGSVQIN